MVFKKFVDDLPKPRAYLAAGLPRPYAGLFSAHRTGSITEIDTFIREPQDGLVKTSSLTVVDDDGLPVAVIHRTSNDFVTIPPTTSTFDEVLSDVTHEEHGFLTYRMKRRNRVGELQPGNYVGPAPKRSATFDLSVAEHGFDRSKFVKGDGLFMSAALQPELAVMLATEQRGDESVTMYAFRDWRYTTPVPFDHAVVRIFKEITSNVVPPIVFGSPLQRVDLMCAATAIAYDAPMYTAVPERYESVGMGLRLIEYGDVRNPA
jgi:hypothetical protein